MQGDPRSRRASSRPPLTTAHHHHDPQHQQQTTNHSACLAAATAGGVTVDAAAAAALAARLAPADVAAAARGGFPVRFESEESEVTFLALYRLLDFGSEFDALLRAAAHRDARETMQFGALGLHLGAKRLDRHFMKDFSAFSVANYFGFEARVEHELQPGITISKPGPLTPLAEAVRAAVNEAGAALERLGRRTLGEHVLAFAEARKTAGEPPLAAALVADLAGAFAAFDDVAAAPAAATAGGEQSGEQGSGSGGDKGGEGSGGEPAAEGNGSGGGEDAAAKGNDAAAKGDDVGAGNGAATIELRLNRKAQALAGDLAARFGASDARFAFEDAAQLCGDSGAAAFAAWAALGILKLPEGGALARSVAEGGELSEADAAVARAAAVAAADAVAAAVAAGGSGSGGSGGDGGSGSGLTAAQLGAWAASLLEEGGELHGKAKPFVLPGTLAF